MSNMRHYQRPWELPQRVRNSLVLIFYMHTTSCDYVLIFGTLRDAFDTANNNVTTDDDLWGFISAIVSDNADVGGWKVSVRTFAQLDTTMMACSKAGRMFYVSDAFLCLKCNSDIEG